MSLISKIFYTSTGVLSAGLALAQSELPNIVFVLADDMGIGDVGSYGQKKIKTPNIDALSAEGIQFMNHYSGATVSAPSRCSLLTGKHTGHTAIRGNIGVKLSNGFFDLPIPENEITVAELLKQRNYATCCVGKWGLGGPSTEGSPLRQGFDYFFGYLSQGAAHRYYPEYLYENEEKYPLNGAYSHYAIMEKGLNFIKKNSDKPFFAYFAVTPPHADLDIPDLGEYENAFDETPFINRNPDKGFKTQLKPRAAYAAMVSEVDNNVGQIIALLKEKGIYENTIIIFSSDNGVHNVGGHDPDFFPSNGPFRGHKRDLYEGGVRTPFVFSWPSQIKQARYSYHISTFWDFLPTVCDIVGIPYPEGIDGISYLPELLEKKGQKQHQYLYQEFHEQGGKQSVFRTDGWKLIRLNVNKPEKISEELYNIYQDPFESGNVINKYPDIAEELRKEIKNQRSYNEFFKFTDKK